MTVRVEVIVSGRVQGVWFRQSTKRQAERHQLTGWVRNNPDSTVEAVFEGEEAAVGTMVDWCRQGPPAARVEAVKVVRQPVGGEFSGFEVR